MIVKRKGGMTEFIPTPQEKREGLIRDNVLSLLENLHKRLVQLECGAHSSQAQAFSKLLIAIKKAEQRNYELHQEIVRSS